MSTTMTANIEYDFVFNVAGLDEMIGQKVKAIVEFIRDGGTEGLPDGTTVSGHTETLEARKVSSAGTVRWAAYLEELTEGQYAGTFRAWVIPADAPEVGTPPINGIVAERRI